MKPPMNKSIQGDVLSIQHTKNNYLIVDQTWVGGGYKLPKLTGHLVPEASAHGLKLIMQSAHQLNKLDRENASWSSVLISERLPSDPT